MKKPANPLLSADETSLLKILKKGPIKEDDHNESITTPPYNTDIDE